MMIKMEFQTLTDISHQAKAEKFLEILAAHDFTIEYVSSYEPIRKAFSPELFAALWNGDGKEGPLKGSMILFKGKKKFAFQGIVIWNKNLSPKLSYVNGIYLHYRIAAKTDLSTIIHLGDELFGWCKAEYGYIGKEIKNSMPTQRNIWGGLTHLDWVNYYGKTYLNERDFHLPDMSERIYHGARLSLANHPSDEILDDKVYLNEIKMQIGREWFREYPLRFIPKVPEFDRSEIYRSE